MSDWKDELDPVIQPHEITQYFECENCGAELTYKGKEKNPLCGNCGKRLKSDD